MAFSASNSTKEARAFSVGPMKCQIMTYTAASGDTAGTVTADRLTQLMVVIADGGLKNSAAVTYSGNVATLAYEALPTATAATLTLGGVTYTAVADDQSGNLITVEYVGGGTAGAEVVTVVGNAISVEIEDGVSTITQVRTAVNLEAAAAALVTATGTSGTAVAADGPDPLTGGITGGAKGTLLCLGV